MVIGEVVGRTLNSAYTEVNTSGRVDFKQANMLCEIIFNDSVNCQRKSTNIGRYTLKNRFQRFPKKRRKDFKIT